MNATSSGRKRIPFEGAREFLQLLKTFETRLGHDRRWAEKFLVSVMRVALERGFDRITFKVEPYELTAFELLAAMQKGTTYTAGKTMKALRLWKGGESCLLRIGDKHVVYCRGHGQVNVSLSSETDFRGFVEMIERTSPFFILRARPMEEEIMPLGFDGDKN